MTRVDPWLLVVGYQRAAGRVLTGGEPIREVNRRFLLHLDDSSAPNPFADEVPTSGALVALFEALNWAVTLDDRFREDWPGSGEWFRDLHGGELVGGLRYARNSVHHDWALAVELDSEGGISRSRHAPLFWVWCPDLPSGRPNPAGARRYRERLAGRPVIETLMTLTATFAAAIVVLAEQGLASGDHPDLMPALPTR